MREKSFSANKRKNMGNFSNEENATNDIYFSLNGFFYSTIENFLIE